MRKGSSKDKKSAIFRILKTTNPLIHEFRGPGGKEAPPIIHIFRPEERRTPDPLILSILSLERVQADHKFRHDLSSGKPV